MLSTAELRPSAPTTILVLDTQISTRAARQPEAELHPLAAARGILIGVGVSLGLWGVILALVL